MKLCIHRGTHQIGGIAAEIATETTRILIDMGDELSLDPNFVSAPLNIPGVTDENGRCDAVLFTHYHGDHTGQMLRIRPEIPIYAGALAKDIMRLSAERGGQKNEALCKRIETIQAFSPGKPFLIGDIQITPFCIDHSACDSYLFLIEADGKRLLYTGDFRLHGVRGHGMDKILDRRIGTVDVVVTEGTTVSRSEHEVVTEWELQKRERDLLFLGAQPPSALGCLQRPAVLCLQSPGPRLRSGAGKRGAGRLCGLSSPGPPGAGVADPGPDGGAAALPGRPVCADACQQPRAAGGGFYLSGQRRGAPHRRGTADLFAKVAGAQTGDHHPPVFGGKDALGAGALGAEPAPGPVSPGQSGRIPAVFVEMRGENAGAHHL